jgi:trans-aconitate methyltransferase
VGLGLSNVEFRFVDITETTPGVDFDLVHARFVLTHLPNPGRALARMRAALRPGGGQASYPANHEEHSRLSRCRRSRLAG